MKTCRTLALAVAFFLVIVARAPGQGTLADASFESRAFVTGGTNGWTPYQGNVSFSQSHAEAGTSSLKADYGFTIDAAMVYQWVTVQPGVTYSLSGWALTPVSLNSAHAGFLYLQFADANHAAIVGSGASTPYIQSGSPVNTWISLTTTATAPANAAYAEITAGMGFPISQSPQGNAVYFDNLSFGRVPEPACAALFVFGLAAMLCFRNRGQGPSEALKLCNLN